MADCNNNIFIHVSSTDAVLQHYADIRGYGYLNHLYRLYTVKISV